MDTPTTTITRDPEGRRRSNAATTLRVLRRALRICWQLACIAMILGVLALGASWKLYGMVPVAVQSGSMTPTLPVHSLIFVKEVPAASVRVGDVITFDPPGDAPRTTHRVVQREHRSDGWYFRTKGDANPTADDWRRGLDNPKTYQRGVSYGTQPAIRYAFHIPELGRVTALSGMPHLRMILFGLPFALLAIHLLTMIWAPTPARTPADDTDDADIDDDFRDGLEAPPERKAA